MTDAMRDAYDSAVVYFNLCSLWNISSKINNLTSIFLHIRDSV